MVSNSLSLRPRFFLWIAGKELGYVEGYKSLQNHKVLIMSALRELISALWGVIHGSNPCAVAKLDLDPKLGRAALEAVWQAIAHGKMINLISPLCCFCCHFSGCYWPTWPF